MCGSEYWINKLPNVHFVVKDTFKSNGMTFPKRRDVSRLKDGAVQEELVHNLGVM